MIWGLKLSLFADQAEHIAEMAEALLDCMELVSEDECINRFMNSNFFDWNIIPFRNFLKFLIYRMKHPNFVKK